MRTDIKALINIVLIAYTNEQGRHTLGIEMVQFHIVCKQMNNALLLE